MRIQSLILPVLLTLTNPAPAASLFKDEAGNNDFTIETAGHGVYGSAFASIASDHQSVITSSSSPHSAPFDIIQKPDVRSIGGGCYFSSRKLDSGLMNWRRNACSQHKDGQAENHVRHAVYSNPGSDEVITMDNVGMVRVWNDTNGNLISEFPAYNENDDSHNYIDVDMDMATIGVPRIVDLDQNVYGGILTDKNGNEVMLFFTNDGYLQGSISAKDALAKAHVKGQRDGGVPSFFGGLLISDGSASSPSPHILAGWKDENDNGKSTTSFVDMALVQISIQDQGILVQSGKHSKLVSGSKGDLLASSISVVNENIHAVNKQQETVSYSMTTKSEETIAAGISVHCKSMTVTAEALGIDADSIASMHSLQCTEFFTTVLVATKNGMTEVFNVKRGEQAELQWEQEEGLSHASSAIFLDKGVAASASNLDDEGELLMKLSFSSRIVSQWDGLSTFVMGGFVDRVKELVDGTSSDSTLESAKDAFFGLNKVAVILSNHFHKVMGVDTASNGSIVWAVDLNVDAAWHKIVHGAATSRSSALGQGKHHPHSPEVLIVSHLKDQIEWKCVDGLKGEVISQASVGVPSPVVQVIPIHGHSHATGGCKQNAVLVLKDNSLVFVPSSFKSVTVENNVFSHIVDKETGVFRSMKVHTGKNGDGSVEVVGETIFDPKIEKIVNVAYPQRNEVVQSPVTKLGDDSLLLKYLNPHLCVVVTEATVEYMEAIEGDKSELFNAFEVAQAEKTVRKKKPAGASKPGEDVTAPKQATATPTLFINLVDTVSGQVLHRASHSHASLGAMALTPTNVPVVISENWILYAFTNAKSRRTEISVLTLHEGMIDKHGITAFSTPEQQLTFSSLTSQKPIVLSKTFSLGHPVSAIGVTNTKGGISSKNIILATGMDGRIIKLDRRLLDPRRPYGEPKKSEKMEGLLQ
jgi:hypothetical protein